ncbi:MAG: hypothetical protein FJW95_06125 [Actinobacteria bacterium]|nr:hypothetical protein [Actinomycetota bacterium]
MTAGGPVDPTMPLPEGERRGAPQPPAPEPAAPEPAAPEPTGTESLPGAYDPTIAVPPVGPPDEPGDPYGPPPGGDDEEPDNRKLLWGILAAVAVILIGIVAALLLTGGDGDNEKADSTTTTSTTAAPSTSTSVAPSTTTSSTTTTPTTPGTTAPNAPVISAFTATPNPFPCASANDSGQLTLTWSTQNATGVTISVDGPGIFGSYGPSGQQQVPFAGCNSSHTYTLTAKGAGNQQVQQTITVQPKITPATTTTTAP